MSESTIAVKSRQDVGPAGTRPLGVVDLSKEFRAKKTRAGAANKAPGADDDHIVVAVDHVNLDVEDGEMVVLLGPSGCGKTTLLRSVAGLESPQSGQIRVAGKLMFSGTGSGRTLSVPTARRGLSMMFQSYALWPHMTVQQNLAYPLEVHHVARAEIGRRIGQMLELLGLDPRVASRYPSQLSGGQQQRVALGRALVLGSPLILFDEPLSNVDAKVRDLLRAELSRMQAQLGFAGLYVTHDQREAFGLGHRIAVMRTGRIEQVGTPREIYEQPASLYVARFVGTTNEIPGTVRAVDRKGVLLDTEIGAVRGRGGADLRAGDEAVAVFRPENCALRPGDGDSSTSSAAGDWLGTVTAAAFEGAVTVNTVAVGSRNLFASVPWTLTGVRQGDAVRLTVAESNVLVLPQEVAR